MQDDDPIPHERRYTCAEVGLMYILPERVIYRLFVNEEGVLRFPDSNRKGKFSLRIPAATVDRVFKKFTVQAGSIEATQ